jgi:hypothetical protein
VKSQWQEAVAGGKEGEEERGEENWELGARNSELIRSIRSQNPLTALPFFLSPPATATATSSHSSLFTPHFFSLHFL